MTNPTLLLALKQNSDGGWGIDEEHLSSLSSSIQVLRALKAAQYNNEEVLDKAIEYLVSNQNDDGGFGIRDKDTHTNETLKDSNIYIISLIVLTCKEYNIDIGSGLLKASEWLRDRQNADGGWGKSWEKINDEWQLQETSSVWETAWAYMALIRTGLLTNTTNQNVLDYILTNQNINGSWYDNAYETALAIRALADSKPNLSVNAGNIALSNPKPVEGESITIL